MSRFPDVIEVPISLVLRVLNPKRKTLFIYPSNGGYLAMSQDEKIYFPPGKLNGVYRLRGEGRISCIHDKYSNEQVFVERGDVVFDVGAFVGSFTMSVADTASHVYAFEPNVTTKKFLDLNTCDFSNVETFGVGIWEEDGCVQLNLGLDPTNDSLLTPDDGFKGDREIKVKRIDTICNKLNIDKVDFMKIDAEGVEPEVLESAGEIDVKKLAIDCGREREGEMSMSDVKMLLDGYEIYENGKMLFAKVVE